MPVERCDGKQDFAGWRTNIPPMMVMSLRLLLTVALVALAGLLTGVVPMGFVWALVNVVAMGLLALGVVAAVRIADR